MLNNLKQSDHRKAVRLFFLLGFKYEEKGNILVEWVCKGGKQMFKLQGHRFGQLLDGTILNMVVIIGLWIIFHKLLHAPLMSLVLAVGGALLAKLVFRTNKKIKNLMQIQGKIRSRIKVQKQIQAWSPEELFAQLLMVLEIGEAQVEQPKVSSWGQHYAVLRDKKIVIAVGQFPGQTVGESTVDEFSDFVRQEKLKAGYYFTTGTFSANAMQITKTNRTVELINLAGMVNLFHNHLSNPVVGAKNIDASQELNLREEIFTFNEKKIRKFIVTALVLSGSGILLRGSIGYYFLAVAFINVILAILSIRQRKQQQRLADVGLKRLQTQ